MNYSNRRRGRHSHSLAGLISMIRSITVYCSSSQSLAPHYHRAGAELGRALGEQKWTLVYGGNAIGLMKTVADAARSAGGKVIGITPQIFVDEGFIKPKQLALYFVASSVV